MNRVRTWQAARRLAPWAVGLLLAACASDDFSAVGSGLPLDVGQEGDSVLVRLDPPLLATSATTVEVDVDQPYDERAILYLGNRVEGAWVATPLFRLDFDQAVLVNGGTLDLSDSLASLSIEASLFEGVAFRVRQTREDARKGIARDLQVREVAGNPALDLSLLDQDISSLQGTIAGAVNGALSVPTLSTPVDLGLAVSWYTAGGQLSILLQDLTPSSPFSIPEGDTLFSTPTFVRPNSNLVSLASIDYTEPYPVPTTAFSELSGNDLQRVETSEVVPKLIFDVDEAALATQLGLVLVDSTDIQDAAIEVPVVADLTHLQHDAASPGDLVLSTYRTRRVWLDFDIVNSAVPGDATINEALLTLHLRPGSELGGERFLDGSFRQLTQFDPNLDAFEVTALDAEAASTSGLDFILNSGGAVGFFPSAAESVQINVTDFVQRDANLLLDGDVGIMLRMNAAPTSLSWVEFYGLDAPVALQPRLEITFTPPADFWE